MVTNTFEKIHVANEVWHASKRPKGFGFGEVGGNYFGFLFQREGEHAIDYFNDFT